MARRVIVGIDDTDMPGTRGTGKLARWLADAFEAGGLGVAAGVTRHQFYFGPGVAYTSHNSGAAIGLETDAELDAVEALARRVMAAEYIDGSDPGLAILDAPAPAEVTAFARRAQREVVTLEEAEELARAHGLRVVGLGGTRGGMIGALGSAALRWDGNDGRYVGLPGIRELVGTMTVAAMLRIAPIARVVDEASLRALDGDAMVETLDWVRPRLVGGEPVMVARAAGEKGAWVNADRHTHEG
ncbi:MAG: ABC transporter substrate-binding protein [Dehalococcoidia bacterium]|nr:ABC transporter substrate-binding protein [Dehalococcoidia bacterium]